MQRRLIRLRLLPALSVAALLGGAEARAGVEAERAPAAVAPAGAPQATPPVWVFGRTPAVFEQARDSIATRVGGWADASFRDNDLRHSSLGIDHFNVYLDTRYRSLQVFVEAEYERETKHTGFEGEEEFELEQAYARWSANDLVSLRVGRFNTPFGWWIPIHWSILMDTIEEPLFVGRELVPEQQLGAEVSGRWFPRELAGVHAELDYSLFAGGGSDELDQDRVKGPSFGGDLRLRLDERWLLGTSYYRQRNRELENRTENGVVLYGEARLHDRLTLRSEYVHQDRESRTGSWWEDDVDVVYGNVRWDFLRRAHLNYRYSYGDDDDEEARDTSEEAIHTITVGVQPNPWLRLKLEWSDHDFKTGDREDFEFWGFSVGVLF
jgi:hypothetical protein